MYVCMFLFGDLSPTGILFSSSVLFVWVGWGRGVEGNVIRNSEQAAVMSGM